MGAAANLAANSSRVADLEARVSLLEARVSLLEAENARLREAMGKGGEQPLDRPGNKKGPVFRRLEEILEGDKRNAAEIGTAGGRVASDAIDVSDGEEEEGPAADAVAVGRSAEEGVLAVPTPRKCAVRVTMVESEDEQEIEGAQGSGGGDQGSVHCGSNVGLEDDDVSITPRRKKRAAACVIASDSEEDEDVRDDKDGGLLEDVGITPSRKRALCGFSDSDNEDGNGDVCASHVAVTRNEEDDNDRIPICEVVKKMRQERVSEDDGSGDMKGCSTPTLRRSARLIKSQSNRGHTACRTLNFVEPKDYEGIGDASEEEVDDDDDMDEFINDEDCSENASDSSEESSDEPASRDASAPNDKSNPEPEDSDSEINYKEIMTCISRKRNVRFWKYEAEMLAAFAEHPELCLKAVCALYRKQTKDEQLIKATTLHNKQGFNQLDAFRGSCIAEFLLDGDVFGPLKKTVHDLEEFDCYGLEVCHKLATRYSKQLFAIYQKKEDPDFP